MFELKIETDNAAFMNRVGEPDERTCRYEIARLLRRVANMLDTGDKTGNINDINGNKVGSFQLLTDEENFLKSWTDIGIRP